MARKKSKAGMPKPKGMPMGEMPMMSEGAMPKGKPPKKKKAK